MYYIHISFTDEEDGDAVLVGLGTHNGLHPTYATTSIRNGGIELTQTSGQKRLIPWHRIKEVTKSENFPSDAMLEEESGSEVLPDMIHGR